MAVCCRNYFFHKELQALELGVTPNMPDRVIATYYCMPTAGLILAYPYHGNTFNGLISFELLCANCIK
jgi:hypothetical protein